MKYRKCDCCHTEQEDSMMFGGMPFREWDCPIYLTANPHNFSLRSPEKKDLCPDCYDKIMIVAVRKFEELKVKPAPEPEVEVRQATPEEMELILKENQRRRK